MADNLNIREPEHRFYQVTVDVEVDNEKGGTKTLKEIHLVDAVSPTDVELKVSQMMEGTMYEWKISSMSISKICYVY